MHDGVVVVLDWLERLGPVLGTFLSFVLMFRRAGKRQVNDLAGQVKRQKAELDGLKEAHRRCEEARSLLLEQNLRLLQRGLDAFPPPGDGDCA